MMAEEPDFERLRSIKTLPQLIAYLRDELGWPLNGNDLDDVTFDYDPSELGFDKAASARIKEIKQFRPLETDQPWGIFWINFEKKNLPVVVLRRILANLAIKKRPSARRADKPAWRPNDLLFISAYGEDHDRAITFAHFSQDLDSPADLPILKVLGWDDADSVLHLADAHEQLTEKLGWPDDPLDVKEWREGWAAAFKIKHREVISSTQELVKELAGLAQRVRKRANNVLNRESARGPMRRLHNAFKETLIHDLKEDDFADVIAQTVSYGLLVARFSRPGVITAQNLVDMIPPTNPFLRELLSMFLSVAGRKQYFDFDELGIQEVIELLNRVNPDAVKADFGDRTRSEDPVIYFYEHFLAAYDKKKKVKRGVFFTPQPVVSYIVRSVHELLQTEFGLEDGLASTITWGEMASRNNEFIIPETTSKDEFFVVVLDPATGTATFLVEVIETIFVQLKKKWAERGAKAMPYLKAVKSAKQWSSFSEYWNSYVPSALLPRLYGYELMVAPYTIAHMKLSLKFSEINARLGQKDYKQKFSGRANIYLTNALEPATDSKQQIEIEEFAPALAHEAQAVNAIKRDQRFTVVLGNPPYSISSSNMGPWIVDLCEEYKRTIRQEETQIQAVSDDYVKFMRLAQWHANRSGYCLTGLITNNGYLRGLLFRDMRSSLLSTFNAIYLVDLHGSGRPGSSRRSYANDENVFDIQTSVAISFMSYSSTPDKTDERSVVLHEMVGEREFKYRSLNAHTVSNLSVTGILPKAPLFPFAVVSNDLESEFRNAPSILEFFGCGNDAKDRHKRYGAGFVSQQDDFAIGFDRIEVLQRIEELLSEDMTESELRQRYRMCSTSQWSFDRARSELPGSQWKGQAAKILYRPFDFRWTVLNRNVVSILRRRVMAQLLRDNLAICVGRQGQATGSNRWDLLFCTSRPEDYNLFARGNNICIPLVYHQLEDDNVAALFGAEEGESTSNLNPRFVKLWRDENLLSSDSSAIAKRELFFYIYGLLHSNSYRARYHDFLSMEFPRILHPRTRVLCTRISELGERLVSLHVMNEISLVSHITTLEGYSTFQVEKVSYSDETVWINKAKTHGFRGVPEDVWNFHIGGYQVCEKWLKDRGPKKGKPGRILTEEDINHYQKIVVALNETIRIMKEIDEVIDRHGGWPGAFK